MLMGKGQFGRRSSFINPPTGTGRLRPRTCLHSRPVHPTTASTKQSTKQHAAQIGVQLGRQQQGGANPGPVNGNASRFKGLRCYGLRDVVSRSTVMP